ncbi:hypothetical protein Tco_1101487 [Tanacetum coccineum]
MSLITNRFQYNVDNVVDRLTTTGITTIPGERRSVAELKGMSRNLKPSKRTLVRVPSRVAVKERLNRSLSLQFERYCRVPQPARYSVDQHDREILGAPINQDDQSTIGQLLVNHLENGTIMLRKVKILDESSNWDDDERSGGKILLEWENSFTIKHGEDHTILYLSEDDDDDNLPYPKFQNFKQMATKIISKHEEQAFPTSTEYGGSYQPPPDAVMGPSFYPPARQDQQQFYKLDYQFGYPQGKGITFNERYGEYHNSQWTLPPV